MTGVLYIVATPIGNLDDISLRAIEILKQVDVIAAEDTRHSIRLLNHLGIRNKLISLHEHNERDRIDSIIEDLRQGSNIALISDAGTPLISDPGYPLVKAVQDAGLRVSPIPGASSIMAALSAAGMPTAPFTFYGFLSQKNSERLSKLSAIKQQNGTLIFLESTHRIERLLEQLCELFGDSHIVVAKELTKSFERFLSGTPSEILFLMQQEPVLKKGEFVVLIDNPVTISENSLSDEDVEILKLLLEDLPLKKAVQISTRISGKKKNDIYQQALQLNELIS
jgi:16S rRNA (cytidine1402-2'-O)-methyltransferase|tara:strand:- start:2568 stop:3410 length:843 start_codon:yes stop_codon:yes gene_type:complete